MAGPWAMESTVTERQYHSFAEFWPFYVRQHAEPKNRFMHVLGTTLGLAAAVGGLLAANFWLLLTSPVIGYGFSWFGHFVLQKNIPATFSYPLWSLRGDFKMWALTVTGRMGAEVERATSGEPH